MTHHRVMLIVAWERTRRSVVETPKRENRLHAMHQGTTMPCLLDLWVGTFASTNCWRPSIGCIVLRKKVTFSANVLSAMNAAYLGRRLPMTPKSYSVIVEDSGSFRVGRISQCSSSIQSVVVDDVWFSAHQVTKILTDPTPPVNGDHAPRRRKREVSESADLHKSMKQVWIPNAHYVRLSSTFCAMRDYRVRRKEIRSHDGGQCWSRKIPRSPQASPLL